MLKQKLLALLLGVVLLFGCSGAEIPVAAQPEPTPSPTAAPTPEPTPQVTTLRFSATGDNLIHQGIYKQANRRAGGEGYDFSYCYDNVRDFYADFDINWINQETLINDRYEPATYPCFSTPGQMARDLYDVGFRVFSISNNHTYDKGAGGIEATLEFWDTMPEDTVVCGLYRGQEDYSNIRLQTVNGVTIAYLAYTEHTNGIPTPSDAVANVIYTSELDVIQSQITQAAEMADLVIVSNHWGVEGSHTITDAQRNLAQQMVDWGADVIIGTHPHVVQNAEWLTSADGRNCFVAYSLGNYLNAQSTMDTMIGAVLDFTIQKTTQPDGSSETVVLSPALHPVINHYDANYGNIRLYWFKDYTDELAAQHGVRAKYPEFSRNYISNVLTSTIGEEFLDLT